MEGVLNQDLNQALGNILWETGRYPIELRIAGTLVKRGYNAEDIYTWLKNPAYYINKKKTKSLGWVPEHQKLLISNYANSLLKSGRCCLALTQNFYGVYGEIFLKDIPEVDIPYKQA